MATAQNIVRLPTAAPRQVKQVWNKTTRSAAFALRDQWPGEYKAPWRRAEEAAKPNIGHIHRTPELAIAVALFGALPNDQRKIARASLQLLAAIHPGEAVNDALALLAHFSGVQAAAHTLATSPEQPQ